MANIASAEKRNRQRIKHRERNVYHLSTMRTQVKKVRAAVAGKDVATAKKELGPAIELLDKAAQKGVIDKKAASRKISRLTQALNHANA